jgi:serine O-acetyltransferase
MNNLLEHIWDEYTFILRKDIFKNKDILELKSTKDIFYDLCDILIKEHGNFKNKYYRDENNYGILNPIHLEHFARLSYYYSRRLFLTGFNKIILDKLFHIIKSKCAIDLFYEFDIQKYFFPAHAFGTVMGRANYGKYFIIGQNCTVGNNHGLYPSFGDGVIMRPNSMVLGKCVIGDNVQIAAGSLVIDKDIPDNTIVFGRTPDLIIKNNNNDNIRMNFDL